MILDKCVVGWDTVEPVFMTNVAIQRAAIYLGKHGTGKTTAAKLLGRLYKDGEFRFYDAPKTDLIALAGIPDPKGLMNGKYEFCRHENTIWDAKVVLVDEISRANKASQNMWLEILQEKKLMGKPLVYETLLATMNPQSYSSVLSLDAALADRFSAVVNIPDPGQDADLNSQTLEILNLNVNPDKYLIEEQTIKEMKHALKEIKQNYDSYIADKNVRMAVFEYVASLISIVYDKSGSDKDRIYISRRKPVQLAEQILGLGAYYTTIGRNRPLERGAQDAILHTISSPLKIDPKIVNLAHEKFHELLSSAQMSREERLRLKLTSMGTIEEKLGFIVKEKDSVAKWPLADLEKELRDIFTSITNNHPNKIYSFIHAIRKLGIPTAALSEAEGFAVLQMNDWVTTNIIKQDRKNWDKKFVLATAKLRTDVVSGKQKKLIAEVLAGISREIDPNTGKIRA